MTILIRHKKDYICSSAKPTEIPTHIIFHWKLTWGHVVTDHLSKSKTTSKNWTQVTRLCETFHWVFRNETTQSGRLGSEQQPMGDVGQVIHTGQNYTAARLQIFKSERNDALYLLHQLQFRYIIHHINYQRNVWNDKMAALWWNF